MARLQARRRYLTTKNRGDDVDRLLFGKTVSATRLQIHRMWMIGGVVTMREVTDGLVNAPHSTVALAPGCLHLMLIGLSTVTGGGHDSVRA